MPKIINTRKQRARELLKRVEEGPCFHTGRMSPEEPEIQYRRWAGSWVLPELKKLVPELHDYKE